MKFQWQLLPYVRIFLFFSLGIIFANYGMEMTTILILMCSISSMIVFFHFKRKLSAHCTKTLCYYLLTLLLGYFLMYNLKFDYAEGPHVLESGTTYVKILDDPTVKKTWSAEAQIVHIDSLEDLHMLGQKIMVMLEPSGILPYKKNDILAIDSKIKRLPHKTDNGYYRYLKTMRIQWLCYASSEAWSIVKEGDRNHIGGSILALKNAAMVQLDSLIQFDDKTAILKAMIFADKSDLDQNEIAQFKRSGTMHILAVSGLHVGIIYLLIFSLCKLLPLPYRIKTQIQAIITCIILWVYVCAIGAPTSACRAAFMFSIFACSKLLRRDYNAINVLAFTAFVQAIINPYIIFQVGFQYSYSAMLGILILLPKLEKSVQSKNKLLQSIWSLFALGLCAQIAISPLSFYYFGTSSLMSSLSSLIVIPLASVSISSTFFGLIFMTFFPFFAEIFSEISTASISIIQKTNLYFSSFSFAEKSLELSLSQLLGIYLAIVLVLSRKSFNRIALKSNLSAFTLLSSPNFNGISLIVIASFLCSSFFRPVSTELILLKDAQNNTKKHNQTSEKIIFKPQKATKVKHTEKLDIVDIHKTVHEETLEENHSIERLDPNVCTASDLIERGIPKFAATNLIKYRNKGAHFSKLAQISKIYGMDKVSPQTLSSILIFPQTPNSKKVFKPKEVEQKQIKINEAGPEDFQSLKGIGPTYAKRIIKFRNALGGFHQVEQIAEVYGLPDSTFQIIKPLLICSPNIRKININNLPMDSLAMHPYIDFKSAKHIIRYRSNHGPFNNLDDLHKVIPISEETISKISPYLELK